MTDRRNSYPNGPKATYREKLLDPRWQKKRLAILERDGWACQLCFDSESTLHVHHRWYEGSDPWDVPDDALLTLCEECHAEEGGAFDQRAAEMVKALRRHFLSNDLLTMVDPPGEISLVHGSDVVASAIGYALTHPPFQKTVVDGYLSAIVREGRKAEP